MAYFQALIFTELEKQNNGIQFDRNYRLQSKILSLTGTSTRSTQIYAVNFSRSIGCVRFGKLDLDHCVGATSKDIFAPRSCSELKLNSVYQTHTIDKQSRVKLSIVKLSM